VKAKMVDNLNQRVAHLEQLIVSRVSSHQNSSVQFATVLVANLMIINSGALFAFSSMIERISKVDPQNYGSWAAGAFVAGIVLATVCGYSAYHNFMALAQYEALEGHENVFDEKFPESTEGLPAVDAWRSSVQKGQRKFGRVVTVTLWTGNISGILSLAAFILGCFCASEIAFRTL
jgi:hypothetical protein